MIWLYLKIDVSLLLIRATLASIPLQNLPVRGRRSNTWMPISWWSLEAPGTVAEDGSMGRGLAWRHWHPGPWLSQQHFGSRSCFVIPGSWSIAFRSVSSTCPLETTRTHAMLDNYLNVRRFPLTTSLREYRYGSTCLPSELDRLPSRTS